MDPVFILSSPRSFTSVVSGMVGMHPFLYSIPELHLLEQDRVDQLISYFMTERQEKKLHGLRRLVSQLIIGEQTLDGVHMADRWLERRMSMSTGDLYRELIEMTGGLGFVDKSPAYSLSAVTLERLDKTFKNAKFIHLVRHPIGQGLSMAKLLPASMSSRRRIAEIRAKYRQELKEIPQLAKDLIFTRNTESDIDSESEYKDKMVVDFQYLWMRMQKRIITFLEGIDQTRKMTLRGEDFLKDPLATMQDISKFVDIPWMDNYSEFVLHPEQSPYACLGPQGAQFGNDVNYLQSPGYSKREFQIPTFASKVIPWKKDGSEFEEEVIRMARALGYD